MKSNKCGFLRKSVEHLATQLERSGMSDYVQYLSDRRKAMWTNFLAGLARGFGMAVGFTILGAIIIILLQRLAVNKLPVIGDFISEIVKIVKAKT